MKTIQENHAALADALKRVPAECRDDVRAHVLVFGWLTEIELTVPELAKVFEKAAAFELLEKAIGFENARAAIAAGIPKV